MMDRLLKTYSNVKTGKDLLKLNIVPKTSTQTLGLITHLRLSAQRDRVVASLNDEMLGRWVPALEEILTDVPMRIEGADVKRFGRPNTRVIGAGTQDQVNLTGLTGRLIVAPPKRSYDFAVEFDADIARGHNCDGAATQGRGLYVNASNINLVTDGKIVERYDLLKGAVADPKLGHLVRLASDVDAVAFNKERGYARVHLPAGVGGGLVNFNTDALGVTIKFDSDVQGGGNARIFTFYAGDVAKSLRVSSLGQMPPVDREQEVYRQVIGEFLPTTVLSTARAEKIIVGMKMGKDMILYGPPGGGKTNAAKDIVSIAKLQNVSFVVERDGQPCDHNCNPFSLFDTEYAKTAPPCAGCKMEYDPSFKDTGIFHAPNPEDVRVKAVKYTQGFGIEKRECNTRLSRMDIAGFKIPDFERKTDTKMKDYDPHGFQPGFGPRTNNGLLVLDEFDKTTEQTRMGLLTMLQDEVVMPEGMRFESPANNVVLGLINDGKMEGVINDRMILLRIGYPDEVDASYDITRRSVHNEFTPIDDVEIPDVHTLQPINLFNAVPMPVTVEKAVDALYIKFRKEYTGPGKTDITGGNRSKIDALKAARAKLHLDQVFFERAPLFADASYAIEGVAYAFCRRVQERTDADAEKAKVSLAKWVADTYPGLLKQEEDTWGCRVQKDIQVMETQIPETWPNFMKELAAYRENPANATVTYERVGNAYKNPSNARMQRARIDFPLMDNLFRNQPRMRTMEQRPLVSMMAYFVKTLDSCSCKVDDHGKQGA